MPVRRLPHAGRIEAQRADDTLRVRQRQRRVQRVGEHLLLMGVRAARVHFDQLRQSCTILRPQQVAHEQSRGRRGDAHHLGEDAGRFGNVVDDAVGDHRPERAGGVGHRLGVDALQPDAVCAAGAADVVAADGQHVFGEVDGDDARRTVLAAQFDGDLGGAGANVEDGIGVIPDGEEVGDEDAVDRRMVHRVVVAGFGGGIHHLNFQDARQHGR